MNRFCKLASDIRRNKLSSLVSENSYNRSLGEMKITIDGVGYIVKNVTPEVHKEVLQKISENRKHSLIRYLEHINRGALERLSDFEKREAEESKNDEYVSPERLQEYMRNLLGSPRSDTNVIPGGVGDRVELKDLNKKQLEEGIKQEMKDHGLSLEEAADIAADEITLNKKEYLD